MNRIIEEKLPELKRLCEKHSVQTLYLFGSAATDSMTSESDIDFMISFQSDLPLSRYTNNYFDLIDALEELFDRPIDLLTEKYIRNPILKRSIDRSKQLIYGRAS